jgi:hypothetical protein
VVGGDAAAGRDDDGEKIVDGFDAKQQQPVRTFLQIWIYFSKIFPIPTLICN